MWPAASTESWATPIDSTLAKQRDELILLTTAMNVQHNDNSPVMIVGHGSSGTSILTRLMRDYLGVAFGTESQFVVHYYRRLPRYGDLADDANLRRLIGDVLGERWFRRSRKFGGFATTIDAVFQDVRERTYRGVLDAAFGQLAKHLGTTRWGDKTPEYTHDLPVIGELFPEAKYVHMVRDGRDVALSVMGRYWGPKNVFTAAGEWKEAVGQVDAFLDTVPAEQKLEISYEGMLSDPVATFRQLVGFLEIENSGDVLIQSIAEPLSADLMRTNYDKWRTRMSPAARTRFERIAAGTLARHGYETIVEEQPGEPAALKRLYWWADNKIRKWTYAGYWQDNLYKAGLRSRDLLRAARSLASSALRRRAALGAPKSAK